MHMLMCGRNKMKEISIKIKTENAAFDDYEYEEVSRILKDIIEDISRFKMDEKRTLYDINGNVVGELKIR
jgi:hypothetical protein